MDKVININGVEYIKKAEYDKAKKDADNIKKIVSSSIADLSNLIGAQKIVKSNQVFSKRNQDLQLRQIGAQVYHMGAMDKNGTLYTFQNRKMSITIKDVIKVDKLYNESTTKEDIRVMSKEIGITEDKIHRIIYNLDKGIFKEYIDEFLSEINTKIERKPAPVENNPEKRRESVLYSS